MLTIFPTVFIYIHTYHLRFILEGAAETSQIFLRDTFYQNYIAMSNTAYVTGGKPIDVRSQFISEVNAVNPSVAFYDIHGKKNEVLFFYFVPDTTRYKVYLDRKIIPQFFSMYCRHRLQKHKWKEIFLLLLALMVRLDVIIEKIIIFLFLPVKLTTST
jgi:hypothetical protein